MVIFAVTEKYAKDSNASAGMFCPPGCMGVAHTLQSKIEGAAVSSAGFFFMKM